ncbi:MAG: hypothetical protein QW331_01405 [Candidatus Woesearchaeota archaeon]
MVTKRGYIFNIEIIIALIMAVAIIAFFTTIYKSETQTAPEKLSLTAIDILNILDKQGKLEEFIKQGNIAAIESSAASLAAKNSRVIVIYDGIPTKPLPNETLMSTAKIIVPAIKNNIYEVHEIVLVIYQ